MVIFKYSLNSLVDDIPITIISSSVSAVNENLKFILSETMAHYRVGGSGFRVNTDNMSIHNSFHKEGKTQSLGHNCPQDHNHKLCQLNRLEKC